MCISSLLLCIQLCMQLCKQVVASITCTRYGACLYFSSISLQHAKLVSRPRRTIRQCGLNGQLSACAMLRYIATCSTMSQRCKVTRCFELFAQLPAVLAHIEFRLVALDVLPRVHMYTPAPEGTAPWFFFLFAHIYIRNGGT
jgi:hypothetical protein